MLGDVLRTVTKHKQECWDLLLDFCEFSVNNPQQTSTCNIPFVPNYGVHPGAPADFLFPSANKPRRNWLQASADALKIA